MQINIDWLSFTVKRPVGEGDTENKALTDVITALEELSPSILDVMEVENGWKWGSGRKPYKTSFHRADFGMSIYLHPRLPHALIEITGKGCATLGEHAAALTFLEAVSPRLTRLDLACDMLTETRPKTFAGQRLPGRFKSHSEAFSESGETVYIGSKHSNRYARCYRYNPPHERSHLLRVEYVIKAEDAKLTAAAIIRDGHYAVATALGEQYGWLSPEWHVLPPTDIELKAYRPERREGKTLFWLNDTIAPLLVRLQREGIIDVEAWFHENVIEILSPSDV